MDFLHFDFENAHHIGKFCIGCRANQQVQNYNFSFVELIFGRFKIEFLSGSGIDFLLYHCNLFVGVVIKVCLLRYILSDEFVGILNSSFLP